MWLPILIAVTSINEILVRHLDANKFPRKFQKPGRLEKPSVTVIESSQRNRNLPTSETFEMKS